MPFGIELSLAVFDRATRFAKGLFKADDSVVILAKDGEHWRSRHPAGRFPPKDPGAERVIATGEALWLEDARIDPRFCDDALVTGPPFLRGYAAAPIQLPDGSTPGALTVISTRPFAYDADNAERLAALADFVAEEWARAHLAKEHAEAFEMSRLAEERLNLAVALAGLHVFEMDYHRRELTKTGQDEDIFERPRTYDDLYRDIFCTVHPADRQRVQAAWDKHMQEGEPFGPEYRIARPDGKEVWVQASAKLFTDEAGRPRRLIGAASNITYRKTQERALVEAKNAAEAANLAKSAFLATMSHEIRTPLNGVLGMAQAMSHDALSDLQRSRLDVIRSSGESLLVVLNDVLDLSKIEAGKFDLVVSEFDLTDLTSTICAGFTELAARKAIGFGLTIEAGAEGLYRGDPARIRQMLYNLIGNAVKFTDAGEVGVILRHEEDGIVIEVRDTGIGIKPEPLGKLFNRFEQADASTPRQYGGSGLGLAICRELAALMRGTIAAQSCFGEGSTFTLRLPLERLALSPPSRVAAPAAPAGNLETLRILVAEDNAVNQLVIRTLLAQAGVEPTVVANGEEAVQAWERQDWDIVLMDIQMPRMDGIAACRAIRAREETGGRRRTPIIALSANTMAHQLKDYVDAGMDAAVGKPIEIGNLFAVLDEVLKAPAGDKNATAQPLHRHSPNGGMAKAKASHDRLT